MEHQRPAVRGVYLRSSWLDPFDRMEWNKECYLNYQARSTTKNIFPIFREWNYRIASPKNDRDKKSDRCQPPFRYRSILFRFRVCSYCVCNLSSFVHSVLVLPVQSFQHYWEYLVRVLSAFLSLVCVLSTIFFYNTIGISDQIRPSDRKNNTTVIHNKKKNRIKIYILAIHPRHFLLQSMKYSTKLLKNAQDTIFSNPNQFFISYF